MEINHLIFFDDLLVILCASLLTTVVFQRLRLPTIVAYLAAGALVGPFGLAWVEEPENFRFVAEFGVVFLLFSLGLEFSLPRLLALRKSVFGLGSVQVLVCTLCFGGAVFLWGSTLEASVLVAGALALSSTAIVTRELAALKRVHTRQGQLAIGVLLFQDLVAVVFLILVPVLASDQADGLWATLGLALAKGLGLIALLLSVGKWLLPPLYREVARAQSEEVFLLSTLVIVLSAAWLTHVFEMSMALGGFVIGMMLGESQFRHQISSDIQSFKIVLLGLFFTTVGMSIQIDLIDDYWLRLILFTLALILIKTALITVLVRMHGDDKHTALQSGLNLAQAGEFGLALLALGVMHEVLPRDQASFIILVAIASMFVSPFLIRFNLEISNRFWALWGDRKPQREPREVTYYQREHVIIGGFGRVGRTIARLLEANGIDYIAIDQDANLVQRQRARDHNVLYGDCSRMEILRACHIGSARMAILTFRSIEMAKRSIEQIRASGVRIPIVVRSYEHGNFEELIMLGADRVVPEMLEASLVISAQVLGLLGVPDDQIENQIEQERHAQLRHPRGARTG